MAVVVQAVRGQTRAVDLLSIAFYLLCSWRVWVWVDELKRLYA